MTTSKQGTGRSLALLLAGALLSSCMAHGQGKDIDIRVYRSYTPFGPEFYRNLLADRAWIFEGAYHPTYRNVVRGFVFTKDGRRIGCLAHKKRNGDRLWLAQYHVTWEVILKGNGAVVRNSYDDGRKSRHLYLFYAPDSGEFWNEKVRSNRSKTRRFWTKSETGQVQDSWPRALADACPGLVKHLPAGMKINEKQTSLKMAELRRQDPDAPVRHFPGSNMSAPGRTGLGASKGEPTTTKEEVLAFITAQDGNIMLSGLGDGYIFVGGQAASQDSVWTDEVWQLDDEGKLTAYGVLHSETDASGQDWSVVKMPGQPELRYPVGYPFPVLPTGHRHAAFQLTDRLVEAGEPVALPWMAARWRDFLFEEGGRLSAAPVAGGMREEGRWRWTRGRLEVWFAEDETEAPFWTDVADMLGMERPKLWAVRNAGPDHPER